MKSFAIVSDPLPTTKKGGFMPETVKGTLILDFEHHATIVLPDGRMFQVSRQDVEEHVGDVFFLRPDAKIEHVFPPKQGERTLPSVLVPDEVLIKLPASA